METQGPSLRGSCCGAAPHGDPACGQDPAGGGRQGAMRQLLKQIKLKYEALIELSMDMNNAVRSPGRAPI